MGATALALVGKSETVQRIDVLGVKQKSRATVRKSSPHQSKRLYGRKWMTPWVIKAGSGAWLRNGSVKYLTALDRIVIEWLSSMSRQSAIEKCARIN